MYLTSESESVEMFGTHNKERQPRELYTHKDILNATGSEGKRK